MVEPPDSKDIGPGRRCPSVGKYAWILVCLLIPLAVMSKGDRSPWPNPDWPRATPTAQGLDPKLLTDLVTEIRTGRTYPDLHSLLVVRNGYMVVEEYFNGYSAADIHTLQSVTKSITSALIGIAIHQGEIKGVEEKILDFFPDMKKIRNMDDWKRKMRLQDLLTMRSGTDYHEGYRGSPHDRLNHLKTGWDRFVLNRKMVRAPGSHFQYDSGGVILLSSMLKRRTGMHADQYADRYLFTPMGISRIRWYKNREGHPHTGGGLYLKPTDMAKFGLLYLRRGRWLDQQLVPEKWVQLSFQRHVSFTETRQRRSHGYGYLWWILDPDPEGPGKMPIYAAMGYMAQYIFVIPEHNMVVVVTGATRSAQDQRKPISFLYSHILPAVHRRSG